MPLPPGFFYILTMFSGGLEKGTPFNIWVILGSPTFWVYNPPLEFYVTTRILTIHVEVRRAL